MIIIQGITVDDFFNRLERTIKAVLDEQQIKEVPKQAKLLTRKELSELLRVSLPTLHIWTKLGLVQSYKIGNRVYYKSTEIDEALSERKYRRN